MGCAKDMYYDPATKSCAFCSELCFSVDIQGTRDECVKRCPGYLEKDKVYSPLPLQGVTTAPVSDVSSLQPQTIAVIVVACVAVLAVVAMILYTQRRRLIKRLKRQDCCADGASSQPHVQECGTCVPQNHAGLMMNQGYPDLPQGSFSYSFGAQTNL